METPRFVRVVFFCWSLLLATPFFVFAYDDNTTHPALTQEIVKFFNLKFPEGNISDADAEYIIQGSIDEDTDARWTRHFYDPAHNRGLSYLGTEWQSAKDWAMDTIAQATHRIQDYPNKTLYGSLKDRFTGETDYSWERAIYEYAWGDKKRGLIALGHTMHLLEDMSVPDHTRNDPHPALGRRFNLSFLDHHDLTNTSPYESFAIFPRGSLNAADNIKIQPPIILSSIDDHIEQMARYSNGNFFSGDTIFSERYKKPNYLQTRTEILSDDRPTTFGIAKINSDEYRLVYLPQQ